MRSLEEKGARYRAPFILRPSKAGIALFAVLLVATACNGEAPIRAEATVSPSQTAVTERPSGNGAGSDDAAPSDGDAAPSDGDASVPGSRLSVPVSGTYVYELSEAEAEATFTDEVRIDDGRITVDSSSSRSGTTATTGMRLEDDALVLMERSVQLTDDVVFECTIEERVELLRFPLEPRSDPRQEWSNERCSGWTETTIEGPATVSAAGREWSVWVLRVRASITTRSTDGQHTFENTYEETAWWSPELGREVKRDRRSRGRLDEQETESRVVPVLREYPRGD